MAQYFVKNRAGDVGNDSNTGLSDAQAFLTLGKLSATALLQPGDTVWLKRGSMWAEQFNIRGAGTRFNSITIDAYGDPALLRPIITAANIPTFVLDSAVAGGDRYKAVAFNGGVSPGFVHREDGVICAGGAMRNLQNKATLVTCTALHDWHYTGADLYVVVSTGEVPAINTITMHAPVRPVCISEFAGDEDFITLKNVICRFSNDTGFYGCIHLASNSVTHDGWIFDTVLCEWGGTGWKMDGAGTNSFAQTRRLIMINCESRFHKAHGAQCVFMSAGSLIDGCFFHGNGQAGFGFAARNSIVRNCRFEDNANKLGLWTNPNTVNGFDHGLYLVGQEPNRDRAFGNLVVDCVAANNAKAGFATDALSSRHTFLRCLSRDNTLFGIMLEGGTTNCSSGNRVWNCTFWNNLQSGLHCVNCHGPFDARNNQFYFNGRLGNKQDIYIEWNIGSWVLHSGTAGVDAVWRHDNIDYDITGVGDAAHVVLTRVNSIAAVQATANTWFKSGLAGAEGSLYVRKTGSGGTINDTYWCDPDPTQVVLNNNNYTPVGEQPGGHSIFRYTYSVANNVSGTTLLSLQSSVFKRELRGFQINPAYVNTGALDFHLGITSPTRDVGQPLPGIPYQGAFPDIGKFDSGPPYSRHRRPHRKKKFYV